MVVFTAVFTGFGCAFAGDAPKSGANDVSAVIIQAKAQELARALV
ncbi:MAG: hypothetical protein WCH57_10425 [Verrucomicrobiota bacterium]